MNLQFKVITMNLLWNQHFKTKMSDKMEVLRNVQTKVESVENHNLF